VKNSENGKFKNLKGSFVTRKVNKENGEEDTPNSKNQRGILKQHPLLTESDDQEKIGKKYQNTLKTPQRGYNTEPKKRKVKFTIDQEADAELRRVTQNELDLMRSRKKIKGMTVLEILKSDSARRNLILINTLGWMAK
jgi:hypothetical protein